MIRNEQIKAAEVRLTGLDGEELGIVATAEALALARRHKVDLICTSLYSSPPPCRLARAGDVKQERQQAAKAARAPKAKEIRLTPHIEEHDYETKQRQIEKLLRSGAPVQAVVRIQGKEGAAAKALLERLIRDCKTCGRQSTGIQLSGKQAAVELIPL